MAGIALTVRIGGKDMRVRVETGQIVALGRAEDGTLVQLPIRSFIVREDLTQILALWLGPENGAGEED